MVAWTVVRLGEWFAQRGKMCSYLKGSLFAIVAVVEVSDGALPKRNSTGFSSN